MHNSRTIADELIDSIINKLFVQFRFNFEYLGNIESDKYCPRNFLLEAKKAGFKNLDGSEILILEDGSDPFGLDRACHLNSFFAFGHPLNAYTFKDDAYKAFNHVTYEAFPFMYGICLFDLMGRDEASPLIFPTDYNFYEESLTKQFLKIKKYENGYILPIYHAAHTEVFAKKNLKNMGINTNVLELKYKVSDYSTELKDSLITINFALTMLFNIILIESALVDLFGYKKINKKIDFFKKMYKISIKEKHILLAFLYSCLHPFAYAVTFGIFRNRYAMRNDLKLTSPHGSFYFGTDIERRPFKEALQAAIKNTINFKHKNNSLTSKEKKALLFLSDTFGIGYSTDLNVTDLNEHSWNKVDYSPEGIKDQSFVTEATTDSPLWRIWYYWWGAYWSQKSLIDICRNKPKTLDKQSYKKIPKEASKLKFDFIYQSSRLARRYLIQKLDDPNLTERKKALFRNRLKKIWNIS